MNTTQPALRTPLRVWPGVAAVVLLWLALIAVPAILPQYGGVGLIIAAACALLVIVWWLFLSRAPWMERLGALVLIVVAVFLTKRIVHPSIQGGMMGMMIVVVAIPVMSLALAASAFAARRMSDGRRRAAIAAGILLGCGVLTLTRTNGMTGEARMELAWRWTPDAEQRLLATVPAEPPPPPVMAPAEIPEKAPIAAAPEPPAIWPGFRGPNRDSVLRGVQIDTDWSKSPPVEMWRRPIGPGWSSFAVRGNVIYTQEQRGPDELVSAYNLKTGEPVWRHRDAARFWESNAGAGPRATPTLSNGRVFALGGTGILNALDARDGSVIWSRTAVSDTGRKIPDWGIASSPLVVGDMVIAATGGTLAAYDAATGKPRWMGPKGGYGYSSPHLATIDGVEQIVLVNGPGAIGVALSDGAVLWTHAWASDSIVQPAVIGSDFLIGSGSGMAEVGTRRVAVARESGGWVAKERWTTSGLKSYFNDVVLHNGHAFGFDGSILACIDLETGDRKWKGGRYGYGQMLLLPDQNLLLVLSEEGELALVSATPDKFVELAKAPAITGKTWNHPVLAGDTLLVRNGEEMAAFRLSIAGRQHP